MFLFYQVHPSGTRQKSNNCPGTVFRAKKEPSLSFSISGKLEKLSSIGGG